MKKFLIKIKNKIINFIKWVWQECKDWRTFLLLLAVCLVMYSPVVALGIIAIAFKAGWAGTVAGAYAAFWAGPFTPFFPLAISITLGIKRLFQKKDDIAEKIDEIKTHHEEHKQELHDKLEEHKQKRQKKRKKQGDTQNGSKAQGTED